MDVLLRRLSEGPVPERATPGSAGFDLRTSVEVRLEPGRRALVPTGIALAIPAGWEGQVRPRSGLAARHGVTVLNAPGTIDSDYRGEIKVPLINLGDEPVVLERGERIAQILFASVPDVRLVEVEELPAGAPELQARGDGGFGSTGRG